MTVISCVIVILFRPLKENMRVQQKMPDERLGAPCALRVSLARISIEGLKILWVRLKKPQ
jgi:hypothetical protein